MRYLPLSKSDHAEMLAKVGVAGISDLYADVPQEALLHSPIADLPSHQGEIAVERMMAAWAARNHNAAQGPFFCGAGAYRHHIPASVDHLIQRGEFMTAYTPYQPEIAQGTLQMLFEFQTQVALLTGMEVANASLYDGATATAEAAAMACRLTKRRKILLSGHLHPHYRDVVQTQARLTGQCVSVTPIQPDSTAFSFADLDEGVACVIVQNPDIFGHVGDVAPLAEAAHKVGALLIVVVTEPVSLGLLPSPGERGADIVCGEGQGLGVGLQFGGPHLGLFACRADYLRQMPGRLCGETVDTEGRRGFVLTLSTREQHIRREKATSNICTNSGLCALAFSVHLSLLGEDGLKRLALLNHQAACDLADALSAIPEVTLRTSAFFNEITIRLPKPAAPVVSALAAQGILAGVPASRLHSDQPELAHDLILAVTELTTDADRSALVAALEAAL